MDLLKVFQGVRRMRIEITCRYKELSKNVLTCINTSDAEEMISGLRASQVLRGYRQEASSSTGTVASALYVSRLLVENPEVQELDMKIFNLC